MPPSIDRLRGKEVALWPTLYNNPPYNITLTY